MTHRFRAMGTTIESWSDTDGFSTTLEDWFEEVEAVCSRFRPESELSVMNRSAAEVVAPSPLLSDVLVAAERARSLTDGIVDVGVGRAVAGWGYDRTYSEVGDLTDEPAAVEHGQWSFAHGSLSRTEGVVLDLGGVAKGWACDRAVESGLASVVSAGGDLRSNHPETTVSVAGPSGAVDVIVQVGVGALATSSTAQRRWKVGGRQVSHIIDPRTMRPVETPIVSATVLADTAVDAEAGAKAVMLHGTDGLAWADAQPWIRGAVVMWEDGSLFATHGFEVAA